MTRMKFTGLAGQVHFNFFFLPYQSHSMAKSLIAQVLDSTKGVKFTSKKSLRNTSDSNDASLNSTFQSIKCSKHLTTVCRVLKKSKSISHSTGKLAQNNLLK